MIVLYNTNFTHNPNAYLTLAIERALRAVVGDAEIVLCDNRTLLPTAASGEHDMLICIDGQRLKAGLIRRARPAFKRVVLWVFEDPFMLDYNLQHLDLFDLVCTNDPRCVDRYRGKGHYLPLAASRSLHRRPVLSDAELDYDIFFAGTMWPNRVPVVQALLDAFPDKRIKLVCTVNEYLPPLPPAIAGRAITRPISHDAFIAFANRSRVVVTLFRDYASHGDVGQATAPGPRLFELGYAGTAQVVECARMPREHFGHTDGVVLVDETDELVAAVARILGNPKERRDRAGRIQAEIDAHHTYEQRLLELLAVSARLPAREEVRPASAAPRRLRVLMCTHSTIHHQVWGGVEVYQQTLTNVLADSVDFYFWIRNETGCRMLNASGEELEHFGLPAIGWLDILSDPAEEMHFSDILSGYEIDVVHVQHLGHHAASLPIIAKAAGCGVVLSVHDFFMVCSRYNLLDYDFKFCNIGERSLTACDVCLRVAEGLPTGVQAQRRLFLEQVFASVDLLLFGTEASERLLLQVFPRSGSIRRAVFGIPLPVSAMPERREALRPGLGPGQRLVVAIVGNFIRTKGADTVLNVIATANPGLFEFHIHGETDGHYRAAIESRSPKNVTLHGRYRPGDLVLGDAEVALHLSIWPETYCISLSEVWKAGAIPIVTDVGALGDRVRHGINGFKVPVGDAAAVIDLLETIRANPTIRTRIRSAIDRSLWVEAPEYARSLLEEYRAVMPPVRLREAKLSLDLGQLHLLPKRGWKDLSPPRHIFDPPRVTGALTTLPHTVDEWLSVQGSEFYLDRVCGYDKLPFPVSGASGGAIEPLDEFSIQGWAFLPASSVAGQLYVTLIHRKSDHVIFVQAERAVRSDVLAIFPSAPSRCGFYARTRFSGKWTDGDYLVGIVNLIGSKAAFQLSNRTASLYEGRVVGLGTVPLNNDAILEAYTNVFAHVPMKEAVSLPPLEPVAGAVVEVAPAPAPVAAPEPRTARAPRRAAKRSGVPARVRT